jgi:23S rRNA (uracil1939-C5)-methyltransferase
MSGEVVAVESASSAVRDLRRNLEDQELYADVIGGDAGRELPAIGKVDLALVDPPRSGLQTEAVEALVATRARRVAYVSCDPATLARDASALSARGYALTGATPVDMFPQTFHVETLALFERSR